MQRRTTTAGLALVLLLGTTLAGCTSGDEDEAVSSPPGEEELEGEIPASGWWCRLIKEDTVEAATGGRSDEARELTVVDEEDHWSCEVLLPTDDGGTETALVLSVQGNAADEADAALGEVQSLAGVERGPEHLGLSYVADTLAVTVLPCLGRPGTPEADIEVPYVVSLRAPLNTAGEATDLLVPPLSRMVREMDQGYGCSPSKISAPEDVEETGAPDGSGATGAPDDSETTTAP